MAAVTFCLSVSCNKIWIDITSRDVEFRLVDGSTKSAMTENEFNIVSLDLLVFSSADGSLIDLPVRAVKSDAQDQLNSISSTLQIGSSVDWFVIANAKEGSFTGIVDKASFLSAYTFLSDMEPTGPVMYASGSLSVQANTSQVSVSLERYVSKVSIGTLDVRYLDSFSIVPDVKLACIMLTNAVGSCPYSAVPSAGPVWYNKMRKEEGLPSSVSDCLVREYSTITIASSGERNVNEAFYAMPNPTDNDVNSINTPEWAERDTRLSIELLIDGTPNWYNIDLPAMECNTHYRVNQVVITCPGADSPDKPVVRSGIIYTVEVMPWDYVDTGIDFGFVVP